MATMIIFNLSHAQLTTLLEYAPLKYGHPRVMHDILLVETLLYNDPLQLRMAIIHLLRDHGFKDSELSTLEVELDRGVQEAHYQSKDPSFHIPKPGIPSINLNPPNPFLTFLSNRQDAYITTHRGLGVDIYILDTGILPTHKEFTDRVFTLYSSFGKPVDQSSHGTMVASCAAGSRCGVASQAHIYNVAVTWKTSELIKAMDMIADHHRQKANSRGSIVNMSFSTDSGAIRAAVNRLLDLGIICVAAAGNFGKKSIDYPAGITDVISVGAVNLNGILCEFSNYGGDVDVYAPGLDGVAADIGGDVHLGSAYGTSAAAGVVSGLMALIIEGQIKFTHRSQVKWAKKKLLEQHTTANPHPLNQQYDPDLRITKLDIRAFRKPFFEGYDGYHREQAMHREKASWWERLRARVHDWFIRD